MPAKVDDIEERARKLFAGPIDFLKSAPGLQFLPDPTAPEIAFAGMTRVGDEGHFASTAWSPGWRL